MFRGAKFTVTDEFFFQRSEVVVREASVFKGSEARGDRVSLLKRSIQ